MTILLTDEEIETLEYEILHRYFPSQQFKGIRKSWEYDFLNNIAKAQAKKILEQIEEIAKVRRIKAKHRVNYITLSSEQWQDLKKEVEK